VIGDFPTNAKNCSPRIILFLQNTDVKNNHLYTSVNKTHPHRRMIMSDWNKKIITEFRSNDGVVGGHFTGQTLLLLHTVGAKSGEPRINPMVTIEDGDRQVVVASAGGSPKHPAWYHNLVANPEVRVEIGTEEYNARATLTAEPERTELYAKMTERMPGFADYIEKAGERVIPVIALERVK
jgi:deazaflavin-dependent oxidoreductase (nitroreductase family)